MASLAWKGFVLVLETGKLGIPPGAITPVPHTLWGSARRKLDEAAEALRAMEAARDRNECEDGWTRFVDSLEEFWHRFYQEGKEKFDEFPGWVKDRNTLIEADPLLNYLRNARHQNQHGRLSLTWNSPRLRIGSPGFNGHIGDVRIFQDGTYSVDADRTPGSLHAPVLSIEPGDPSIPPVTNRGKLFSPPTEHLGELIGSTHPLAIGNRGWNWYNNAFCDAIEEFGDANSLSGN